MGVPTVYETLGRVTAERDELAMALTDAKTALANRIAQDAARESRIAAICQMVVDVRDGKVAAPKLQYELLAFAEAEAKRKGEPWE